GLSPGTWRVYGTGRHGLAHRRWRPHRPPVHVGRKGADDPRRLRQAGTLHERRAVPSLHPHRERFVVPLNPVTPGEGRDLSSRRTQDVVRDLGIGNLSTPKSVQKLQTALHAKAKAEAGYRFYALYDKIGREDILAHAHAQCRSNKGAPGAGLRGHRSVW